MAQHITPLERFYEIYPHSLSVLSLQDGLVLNEVQALPSLTEEAQSMLKRLLYALRTVASMPNGKGHKAHGISSPRDYVA